jgi:hypothetical protein
MRARFTVTVGLMSLLVAACGSGQATDLSPALAPTTTAVEAEAIAYAYSYAAGDHHDYEFDLNQDLDMTVEAEGDDALLGEELPGAINVTTSVAGTVSYDVAEGPAPGTHQIAISGVFDSLEIEGTVDGEPVDEELMDQGTVPDLVEAPDLTIVIDEYGNLVSVDGEEVPTDLPFFGDPFSQLGGFTSGGLSGHFGPAFPDEPLAVGDEWSTSQTEEIEEFDATMSVETSYRVTGTEEFNGQTAAVIDFETRTSGVELDLGAMFQALFDAFGEMGSELGDDTTATTVALPELEFLITVEPSTATGTVWFDQSKGIVVKSTQNTITTIAMVMDFSDPEESVRTSVTMDLDMDLTAELVEGPST